MTHARITPRKCRRAFVLGLAAATMSAALSACGDSDSDSKGSSGEFLVGTVQSLSGPFETVGKDTLNGLKAEADILNAKGGILGRKIRIVSKDDGSDESRAISAAQQMIQSQKLDLFVPSTVLGPTQLPFAKNVLSVNLCTSPDCGDGKKFPLTFSANLPAESSIPAVLAYIQKQGLKRVGVLAQQTESGQSFDKTIGKLAPKYGLKVVGSEFFDPTATKTDAQVQKLRAAGADVVAGWAIGSTLGLAASSLQSLDWDVPLVGPPAIFTGDTNSLVPAKVASQITCACYSVGVRTGSTVPEEVAPLVKAVGKYAKPTSLVVSAVAADTLALANYGFTKAGKVDSKAAANALAKIGADSDYPAEDFWVFRHANPAYHGTVHSPLDADLSNGFFSVAHPGETVGGTYPGKPLTF